jgi:hypothetical protein
MFYFLDSPHSVAGCLEWSHDEMELEGVKCPINTDHQHAGRRLSNLHLLLGKRALKDFNWTWYSECVVADTVLKAFRRARLTGFEALPVQTRPPLRGKRLWELAVRGWGGVAAKGSGIRLKEMCRRCGYTKYLRLRNPNKLVDLAQWDGSDFFMVWPLPRFIFINDRVREVIADNRFRGCRVRPLDDLLSPDDTGYSPGLLRYWLPDRLARKYGVRLGIY